MNEDLRKELKSHWIELLLATLIVIGSVVFLWIFINGVILPQIWGGMNR